VAEEGGAGGCGGDELPSAGDTVTGGAGATVVGTVGRVGAGGAGGWEWHVGGASHSTIRLARIIVDQPNRFIARSPSITPRVPVASHSRSGWVG
jgi:hypothetical protein